jgi:hypothetical protein
MKKTALSTLALLVLSGMAVLAAEQPKTAETAKAASAAKPAKKAAGAKKAASPAHVVLAPDDIKWGDGPPMIPPGAKAAVLEGDPGKTGPFAIRLRLPDGYKVPPHWHPTTERVTVISGTFHIGMGDKFDDTQGKAMPAGSFASLGAKGRHYAWATGETEIQVNATGPFAFNYVNPADDPRNAKK